MPRSRVRTACSGCSENVIPLDGYLPASGGEISRQFSSSSSISYFFCMIKEKKKVLFICLML